MKVRVLSETQIEELKRSTEYLLENVGFHVPHEGILKLAANAGAKVDEAAGVIRLPAELLRELLSRVPSRYSISTVDGKEYEVGGGKQNSLAIVTDPWIIDYDTQTPRRPCLEDVRKHTIIAQKLDHVSAISRMDFPVVEYGDATSSLRALEIHLLNHTKHYFVYAGSLEGFQQWLELGSILSGGRELSNSRLMTVAVAIVSPLTLTDINVELLLGATANNFPVIPTICPMAGTTSPYSKDTTLLLGNAENIFVAALTQILNPGNPFLYLFGPSRSNMRTGHDMYYTVDKVLWKAAATELAKSYGIPVAAECGGTMTYRYDQQNGAEGMLFMLAAQNTGSDFLNGIGSCHNANGMSAEMMLIQSAWLEAARFMGDGISTCNLERGIESVLNAGHGGNFLTDDLTLDLLRSGEFFKNAMFDFTGGYEDAPSMLEKAHNEVEKMIHDYRSPVPESIQEDLQRYFRNLYR
jgi:trimethylamine--corrinoid protein Co-methyltransferase